MEKFSSLIIILYIIKLDILIFLQKNGSELKCREISLSFKVEL